MSTINQQEAYLSPDLFERAILSDEDRLSIVRPSISYWRDAWRRLRRNPVAMTGLVLVVLITLIAILAPWLTPYDYFTQDLTSANEAPSGDHWFGIDALGRDVLTRVLYGSRISMTVAYVSAAIIFFVGVIYGGIAGYVGGRTDMVMMRIVDIISGIPNMLYLILFMVTLGPGLRSIILALGITLWMGMARMVRAEVLSLRNQEFTIAAQALGISRSRILVTHLIPNSMGTIIVNLTFAIPIAIFSESFLSFLGLGVSAPQASWGTLSAEALQSYMVYPHQLLFPALAICITILAFNFLGDGLRDALDPKMRK
ncbi:MAG: ABC transporter permease [Spirochaetota bacterium]